LAAKYRARVAWFTLLPIAHVQTDLALHDVDAALEAAGVTHAPRNKEQHMNHQARNAGLWGAIVLGSLVALSGCAGSVADSESTQPEDQASSEALVAALPANCQAIATQLADAQELLAELQDELAESTNPRDRSNLLQLLKSVRSSVARLRTQLDSCKNPPPALPDLTPARIVLSVNPGGATADAALVLKNAGQGAAHGPFQIAFGSTVGSVFRQINFQVPASLTILPGGEYTSDAMHGIQVLRDASGTATYVFDALVDSEQQVSESNESNNNYHAIIRDHR
jgi:hypothetical protein